MSDNTQPENSINWDAKEFTHHEKTLVWYIVFTLIAIGLIVYSILSGSILTMVTFGLIVLLGFLFSHRQPRVMPHSLTSSGIILGDTIIPYKNIKSFWIIYEPPQVKTLNIETTAYLNRHVTIQLGDQDPVPVKLFLKKYLPEDLNRDESFVDIIQRHLKI